MVLLVVVFAAAYTMRPVEIMEVNLAYQYGFHYGTHIIMDHFDLIEKHSNDRVVAVFHKISGGSAVNEAIIAGNLQFGSMSPHAALKGIDAGVGTKIFISMGSKVAELWTWRNDIQSIADFSEGDIISVVKIGSVQYVSMIKAFTELNRTKEEAEALFGYFNHANALQLMEQKEIDAHYGSPPYVQRYAELGYHRIANDSMIWGTQLSGSVLIASVDFCEDNPDIASAVMDAWIEATDWIIDNPQEASRIIGEVYEYGPDEAWEDWQISNLTWNPTYGLDTVDDLAETMYELGLLNKALTLEDALFEETRELIE